MTNYATHPVPARRTSSAGRWPRAWPPARPSCPTTSRERLRAARVQAARPAQAGRRCAPPLPSSASGGSRRPGLRRRGPEPVEPHRLGPAADCPGRRPDPDPHHRERPPRQRSGRGRCRAAHRRPAAVRLRRSGLRAVPEVGRGLIASPSRRPHGRSLVSRPEALVPVAFAGAACYGPGSARRLPGHGTAAGSALPARGQQSACRERRPVARAQPGRHQRQARQAADQAPVARAHARAAAGPGAAGRQVGHGQRSPEAQVAGPVAKLPQDVGRRAGQAAQPHDRMGGAQPAAAHPGAPELRRNQAVVARTTRRPSGRPTRPCRRRKSASSPPAPPSRPPRPPP